MTRTDVEWLRACLRRAPVRELRVRARGFELDAHRPLQPLIAARIVSYGAARTLYQRRERRCRSLDALHPVGEPGRGCAECALRARCTAQLRLDLVVERQAWRLLLERSSLRRFLDYQARLLRRAVALEDIVHRIAVIDRGAWGELRFRQAPPQ